MTGVTVELLSNDSEFEGASLAGIEGNIVSDAIDEDESETVDTPEAVSATGCFSAITATTGSAYCTCFGIATTSMALSEGLAFFALLSASHMSHFHCSKCVNP